MAIKKKIIMNSNWKSIGQIIEEIDFDEIFNLYKESSEPLEPQSGSGKFDKQTRREKGK